jgi:hypothetical protein
MRFCGEDVLINRPKITEGLAVFVILWDCIPEAETGLFATVTYDKGYYLPRSTANGDPYPPCSLFFQDETPKFIQFEHII